VGNKNIFFKELLISATAFPSEAQVKFPKQFTRIIITNDGSLTDGSGVIHFGFRSDDSDPDGKLYCSDQPIVFDELSEGKLWFRKSATPDPISVRVWAWRGGAGR